VSMADLVRNPLDAVLPEAMEDEDQTRKRSVRTWTSAQSIVVDELNETDANWPTFLSRNPTE
jgi:hypothetical protein